MSASTLAANSQWQKRTQSACAARCGGVEASSRVSTRRIMPRRGSRRRRGSSRSRSVGGDLAWLAVGRALAPRRVAIGGPRRLEGRGERIVDVLEPDELQLLARVLRDLLEVLAVARRQHHGVDARTQRRQRLLL